MKIKGIGKRKLGKKALDNEMKLSMIVDVNMKEVRKLNKELCLIIEILKRIELLKRRIWR